MSLYNTFLEEYWIIASNDVNTINGMYDEAFDWSNASIEKYLRVRFREHFMESGLAEELIECVWHPNNFRKFKYLDPETFEDFDFNDLIYNEVTREFYTI